MSLTTGANTPGPSMPTAGVSSGAEVVGEPPPFRRLRVYAFDPSLDTRLETAVVNRVTIEKNQSQ